MNIPHIKQSKETSCGAATLAMIYQYFGVHDQTEQIIWDRLKTPRTSIPGEHILKTISMAKDSLNFGLIYFWGIAVLDKKETAMQPIKEFLKLNIPVIVCQKISEENELGHFRVITGLKDNYLIINDPMSDKGGIEIDMEKFLSLWKKSENGEVIGGDFITIFKKEQMPPDANFVVSNFESPIKQFKATEFIYD